MILRRLGNKQMLTYKIIPHFPKHDVYYEPFFGTGSIFFSKPKAKYSYLNDMDSDVFNLFIVVKDRFEEFERLFSITPINEELFYYWRDNKEVEPVSKALRFLYLSSFSYLGKSDTFMLLHSNCAYKEKLNNLITVCSNQFKTTTFRNKDFRDFFNDIYVTDKHIGKDKRFIYSDPPYLDTTDNYNTPKWTKKDVIDLLDTLVNTGIKFAMSEFDHPFILEQAEKKGLNVIIIGERQNLKNRRTEILVTNYINTQYKLF